MAANSKTTSPQNLPQGDNQWFLWCSPSLRAPSQSILKHDLHGLFTTLPGV